MMFLMHAGLTLDSEPKWPLVGSYGKKLVTLRFWYRQINCSYRLIDWHGLIDWCFSCTQGWQWAAVAAGWLSMERNFTVLVQTNKLAVIEWSIGMQWLIDRFACIDWLVFLYARRVGSEPQWPLVGLPWKETLLYWYRQINWVIEWSIGMQWLIDRFACIDWLVFLYARRVGSEPQWPLVGSLWKERSHCSRGTAPFYNTIIFLSIVTDPDPQYFAGSWSALKAHESGPGPDLKRFIVFYILNYRSVETLCHF